MKKFIAATVILSALSGCNPEMQSFFLGLPKDVTTEDLPIFDDAVASIGCKLVDESDYLPVEFQTGFPRAKVQSIATYKVGKGEAVMLENGGFQLVSGPCPPLPAPATTEVAVAG